MQVLISVCRLHSLVLSTFILEKALFAWNQRASWHSRVGSFLSREEQEKYFARCLFDAFDAHSDLVHYVTDTHCWAQNGSTHGRVFAASKRRFLTNWIRNRVKSCCLSSV